MPAMAADKPIKLAYICNNFNDTFQTYIVDNAKKAAQEAGVAIDVSDSQEDDIRQQDQVNNALLNGVSALLVVPVNTSSVQPMVEAAAKANVPLIFINRNPYTNSAPPKGVYYIGGDSVQMGRVQMERAGELMHGKGNICILMGLLSNESTLLRTEGIKQVIKEKYPNIKILATEAADWQRDQGMNVAENWLTAYGNKINAVLSNNDEMALGATMALSDAGRKDVLVFGNDAIPDALAAIKDGRMSATVMQDPVAQGKGSVELALKILKGEKVPQIDNLPSVLIDKSNAK